MHLFGTSEGPHLHHIHVSHDGDCVLLDWQVRNAPEIFWRVLRSFEGYASSPDPLGGDGHQALVGEGTDTHLSDDGCAGHTAYYTLFAKEPDGSWQRQIEAKVRPHDLLHWLHPDAEAILAVEKDLENNPIPVTRALRYRPLLSTHQEVDDYLRIEGE